MHKYTEKVPEHQRERINELCVVVAHLAQAFNDYVQTKLAEGEHHPQDILLNASSLVECYIEATL